MKKRIVIILVVLAVIAITGCSGTMRTPCWSEDEILQMQYDGEKSVPIVKYEF